MNKPNLFVDVETGGFKPDVNGLLSLAYIVTDGNVITDARYVVCRPREVSETTCEQQALNVNKFKIEDIDKRIFLDTDVADNFWFMTKGLHDFWWCGQNPDFDIRFLINKTKFGVTIDKEFVCDSQDLIIGIRDSVGTESKSKSLKNMLIDFPKLVGKINDVCKAVFGEVTSHHDARFDCCAVYVLYNTPTTWFHKNYEGVRVPITK